MLTLYHFWSSTCSRRVRICLAEKQIEWQSRHVDIAKKMEQLEPWYQKLNANGVVPTIDHDGNLVIESNIIIQYLDEAFPGPSLTPEDPLKRARMRELFDRFEQVVHANINVISYNRRHLPRVQHLSDDERRAMIMKKGDADKRRIMLERLQHGVSEEDEARAEARLANVLDELEAMLDGRDWLLGDDFSLADISIAPFIERFEANRLDRLVDFSVRPRLGTWWTRLQARAGFREAYAFTDPDAPDA
ncbi:MAG: glutathione S-transferase N-terminal domain-containing protein [Rhodospirillales bacterium]|jgi:glutathione S-transferase/GST-like protein|nr:glutathione S-transferase N-terminal domain-containing protein [Rhodospirillales bacterium]